MKTQELDRLSGPRKTRRTREKGLGLAPALLGAVCVVTLFVVLALLFHAE
jgi:hypothetical protein